MTYNPFKGANQTNTLLETAAGEAHKSYMVEDVDGMLSLDSDEQRRLRKRKKTEENEKQKMAVLLERIVYQLEKLRFILQKNILPRDMTLRLFDSQDHENNEMAHLANEKNRKLCIGHLNNNR